jgi:hypothetical protein
MERNRGRSPIFVLPRLANRHALSAAEIEDLVDILSIQAEIVVPLPCHEPI